MIDFLKYKYFCGLFSLILFISAIGAYFYRGGFNYSVDFTGGSQVLLRFNESVNPEAIKDILKNQGYKGVNTREFSKNEILVRVQEFSADSIGS